MQTQIYYANQLISSMPLRSNLAQTTLWLQQLLQDEEVSGIGPFKEQGQHMLRGPVLIRGERMTLIFEHKGSGDHYRISALRVDGRISPDTVIYLRFVIRRNGRTLTPPLTVRPTAFSGQPDVMGIRHRASTSSGGLGTSTPYKDLPSYVGERQFVEAVRALLPDVEIDWVNQEKESGLPYDVLIDGRVAVDVKATGTERPYVGLSSAERAFREQHLSHHVIALVTLQTDVQRPPQAIDLYTGAERRRIPLTALADLVRTLPPLPDTVSPVQASGGPQLTEEALQNTSLNWYFRPGRFDASEGGAAWHFAPDGTWSCGEQAGTYRLSGHHLIARAAAPGSGEVVLTLSAHPVGWTLIAADGASWMQLNRDDG